MKPIHSVSCVALLSLACGADPATPLRSAPAEQGPPESTYDPEHVVQVELELDPNDWEQLRYQGRSLFQLLERDRSNYEYLYFDARVTVDGQHYDWAGARKKGYSGSVSALRPSLRLDLGRNQDAFESGLRRLTLNNDRQDPTHVRQCLSYALFARAGLPAPRCNLARVTVNGEDLGIYTNVEPIKKPFLRRFFANADGQLYEGQLADLIPEDVDRIQQDDAEGDRSDLNALIAALQASDADLVSELTRVLDLDRFRDFWALEVLLGHWDGYSNKLNNYYLYHDPTSDKFVFIPWGTDQAFEGLEATDVNAGTRSVYAAGRISSRLYAVPEQRQLFRQRLAELNDQLWDAPALQAEAERWLTIARSPNARGPNARSPNAELQQDSLEQLQTFLATHGDTLRAELSGAAPEWIERPRVGALPTDDCTGEVSTARGDFRTQWGDLETLDPDAGNFDLQLQLDGSPLDAYVFGGAGHDLGAADPELRKLAALRYVGVLPDDRVLLFQFNLPPQTFRPGTHKLHALETFGAVGSWDDALRRYSLIGLISDGSVTLDSASPTPRAPVTGHFNGRFYQLVCSTSSALSQ